jgi:hypothetical protein
MDGIINTPHMNTTRRDEGWEPAGAVSEARAIIEREFAKFAAREPRVFRLALNEAEALAYQTEFPHLVFPVLATEKAEAVAAWQRRQQSIRRAEKILAFAA